MEMKQRGLPFEDLPTPQYKPHESVETAYREAHETIDNVRQLVKRPERPPEVATDGRKANIPPGGNPELFQKAS
jgi:hypothetical protein